MTNLKVILKHDVNIFTLILSASFKKAISFVNNVNIKNIMTWTRGINKKL